MATDTFVDFQTEEFLAFFNKEILQGSEACPVCHMNTLKVRAPHLNQNADKDVDTYLTYGFALFRANSELIGNDIFEATGHPLILVSCDHCGNVRLFDAFFALNLYKGLRYKQ